MSEFLGSEEGRFLTGELEGTGGVIKERPEDFVVVEVPLYEPAGSGDHSYVRFRKRGIPTQAAVDRLAKALGVRSRDVGVAGLKDAQAVTEQTVSIEHVPVERILGLVLPDMEILSVERHGNKLKTGHLRGNRFVIRIRKVGQGALARAEAVCSVLLARGVPNFFGEQRFGARGDTGLLGGALVSGNARAFLDLFLGGPIESDPPECRRARAAYDEGNVEGAMELWPRHMRDQRAALAALGKRGEERAVEVVDQRLRRLFVSAFQSTMFNDVLAARLGTLDKVMVGDLAQKRDSGGIFLVEDEAAEAPRAERFEISPTGPIIGERCRTATGLPGEIESSVLARYGIHDPRLLTRAGSVSMPGGRRALRYLPDELQATQSQDQFGPYLELSFIAPSGCYATVLLNEVMKSSRQRPD